MKSFDIASIVKISMSGVVGKSTRHSYLMILLTDKGENGIVNAVV